MKLKYQIHFTIKGQDDYYDAKYVTIRNTSKYYYYEPIRYSTYRLSFDQRRETHNVMRHLID